MGKPTPYNSTKGTASTRAIALKPFKYLSMASVNSYFRSMTSHLEVHPKLAYALLAILAISVAHYAVTVTLYHKAANNKSHQKTPPVVPHFLPFLGNVPWQFAWNPIEFFRSR